MSKLPYISASSSSWVFFFSGSFLPLPLAPLPESLPLAPPLALPVSPFLPFR